MRPSDVTAGNAAFLSVSVPYAAASPAVPSDASEEAPVSAALPAPALSPAVFSAGKTSATLPFVSVSVQPDSARTASAAFAASASDTSAIT